MQGATLVRCAICSNPLKLCSSGIGEPCLILEPLSIPVRAFGRDSLGVPFSAVVAATRISSTGALLAELRVSLLSGHRVGVQYQSREAQFRVVWARDGRIAVHRCGGACPWAEELRQDSSRVFEAVHHRKCGHSKQGIGQCSEQLMLPAPT